MTSESTAKAIVKGVDLEFPIDSYVPLTIKALIRNDDILIEGAIYRNFCGGIFFLCDHPHYAGCDIPTGNTLKIVNGHQYRFSWVLSHNELPHLILKTTIDSIIRALTAAYTKARLVSYGHNNDKPEEDGFHEGFHRTKSDDPLSMIAFMHYLIDKAESDRIEHAPVFTVTIDGGDTVTGCVVRDYKDNLYLLSNDRRGDGCVPDNWLFYYEKGFRYSWKLSSDYHHNGDRNKPLTWFLKKAVYERSYNAIPGLHMVNAKTTAEPRKETIDTSKDGIMDKIVETPSVKEPSVKEEPMILFKKHTSKATRCDVLGMQSPLIFKK